MTGLDLDGTSTAAKASHFAEVERPERDEAVVGSTTTRAGYSRSATDR